MTIATHNLGMSYLDTTQLPAMLVKEENNISVPYADFVGIATIGIGVNLKEKNYMALVLDQLGVFSAYIGQVNAGRLAAGLLPLTATESNQIYKNLVADFESVVSSFPIVHDKVAGTGNSTSETNLQKALDAKLESYLNDPSAKFMLSADGAQAKAITNKIILGFSVGPFVDNGGKQKRLDDILNANGSPIPHDSPEYMALMSLFYNSEVTTGRKALIGPKLRHALAIGNRADAWYEIRYGSNGGSSQSPGVASRRYGESALFGLYDNATAPDSVESRSIYRMFTAHRNDILVYQCLKGSASEVSPQNPVAFQ